MIITSACVWACHWLARVIPRARRRPVLLTLSYCECSQLVHWLPIISGILTTRRLLSDRLYPRAKQTTASSQAQQGSDVILITLILNSSMYISQKVQDTIETKRGCLQIQTNKFPGDFQDTFNKVPAFLHWSSLLSITTWDTNTCTFSYE